jgi:hypothetical protein
MSTISIEDDIRRALEANAARRGLSLSEYLKVMASADAGACANGDERSEPQMLRARLRNRILEAEGLSPEPTRLNGAAADFADAAARKHKRIGR